MFSTYKTWFLLCLVFGFISFENSAQVSFLEIPINNQFYPRNLTSDSAQVQFKGIVSSTRFNKAVLKTYRNNSLISNRTQDLTFVSGTANFNFSEFIKAELVQYKFEILLKKHNGMDSLIHLADKIVAGDAFIINGQSNSIAGARSNEIALLQNDFVRTYGFNTNDSSIVASDSLWHIANAGAYGQGIGIWGMKLAMMLIDSIKIPIAILHGGKNGLELSFFLRNDSFPQDLNTYYGRLLYRVEKAKLNQNIRAIFWHQGENASNTSFYQYFNLFKDLYQSWYQDYSQIEQIYLFQTRKHNCSNNGRDYPQIREDQRILQDSLNQLTLISTNDFPQDNDFCHYDYSTYIEHAKRLFNHVHRDLYQKNYPSTIASPNISLAFLNPSDSTEIILKTRNQNDGLTWTINSHQDFKIEGSPVEILSGSANGNTIKLRLSDYPFGATGISYAVENHSVLALNPPFYNSSGISMLSFYNFPIGNLNPSYFEYGTGPGGIGALDWKKNSHLDVWLQSNKGVKKSTNTLANNGDSVLIWKDEITGKKLFFDERKNAAVPRYSTVDSALNFDFSLLEMNHPTRFDFRKTGLTGFLVLKMPTGTNNPRYIFGKGNGNLGVGFGIQTWSSNPTIPAKLYLRRNNGPRNYIHSAKQFQRGQKAILSFHIDDLNSNFGLGIDGEYQIKTISPAGSLYSPIEMLLGGMGGGGTYAQFYEVILFSRALNETEQKFINNYLSAKHNIPIENDFFDENKAGFYNDLVGIGKNVSNQIDSAKSNLLSIQDKGFLTDINDNLMFANNNNSTILNYSNDSVLQRLFPNQSNAARLAQKWFIALTDSNQNGGTIQLTFHVDEVSNYQVLWADYHLLVFDNCWKKSILNPIFVNSSKVQFLLDAQNIKDKFISFATSNSNSSLPIHLVSFQAEALSDKTIQLNWATESEINNEYFSIERSIDKINFESILEVKATKNQGFKNYTAFDKNPLPGFSYYRLKQTDFDAQISYSSLKSVYLSFSKIDIYPNLILNENPIFAVEIQGLNAQSINVQVYDLFGKLKYQQSIFVNNMNYKSYFNTHEFSSGIYLVQVTQDNQVLKRKKIIVQ